MRERERYYTWQRGTEEVWGWGLFAVSPMVLTEKYRETRIECDVVCVRAYAISNVAPQHIENALKKEVQDECPFSHYYADRNTTTTMTIRSLAHVARRNTHRRQAMSSLHRIKFTHLCIGANLISFFISISMSISHLTNSLRLCILYTFSIIMKLWKSSSVRGCEIWNLELYQPEFICYWIG